MQNLHGIMQLLAGWAGRITEVDHCFSLSVLLKTFEFAKIIVVFVGGNLYHEGLTLSWDIHEEIHNFIYR